MLAVIRKKIVCVFVSLSVFTACYSQEKKQSITLWDGMAIAGYVDNGGFVNFGGPTVKLVKKPWSFGFGILPTMRIKKDKVPRGAIHNSIITPTAGFGFTMVYKHFIVQLPFYYNSKTPTTNGRWNTGIGVGYKFY